MALDAVGTAPTTQLKVQTISFLDLPAEIRNRIYAETLTTECPIEVCLIDVDRFRRTFEYSRREYLNVTFLRTCSAVYNEGIKILYGGNRIDLYGDAIQPFFDVCRRCVPHIRNLRLSGLRYKYELVACVAKLRVAMLESDGMTLQKLELPEPTWRSYRTENVLTSMVEKLIPFLKATLEMRMKEGDGLSESGVLNLVQLTSRRSYDWLWMSKDFFDNFNRVVQERLEAEAAKILAKRQRASKKKLSKKPSKS